MGREGGDRVPAEREMGPAWEERPRTNCGGRPNLASLSLRGPHEATWSLHVGTLRPQHALHTVYKTEANTAAQYWGSLVLTKL